MSEPERTLQHMKINEVMSRGRCVQSERCNRISDLRHAATSLHTDVREHGALTSQQMFFLQ